MKAAAIACWVVQGMGLFGNLFLSDQPFIPADILALGFPFILLYLLPQFLFLILGCVFFAVYRRRRK